jgi:transmembrane sensor
MAKEELYIKLQRLLEQRLEWTREEKQWLLEYLENSDAGELKTLLEEKYHQDMTPGQLPEPGLSKEILRRLHAQIKPGVSSGKARLVRMRRISVAAACIAGLLIFGGALWLQHNNKDNKSPAIYASRSDIPPGGNNATLTLDDGTRITLENAKNGSLARQGKTTILKFDGKVSYDPSVSSSGKVMYNTITTPRGGQYEIELPDHSHVWLNAASSIRFPTAFAGKQRRVEIMGEAYFEISKHPNMPFFVKVGSSEVQVLGTHFNVMAYTEESAIRTTLLEGSVRFVNGQTSSLLAPGQQSQLNKDGGLKVERNVNNEEVIAWKNGLFHFENVEIETVMRQLSRWYAIDVVYKNKRSDNLLYADIPRTTNLSDALKALELTGGIHFEVQGKKVIVEE